MKQYNIAEAKAHFSELVNLAICGEDVVIAKDKKPIIKLMPLKKVKKKRIPGTAKGLIMNVSSDFDETPDDFKEYV